MLVRSCFDKLEIKVSSEEKAKGKKRKERNEKNNNRKSDTPCIECRAQVAFNSHFQLQTRKEKKSSRLTN